MYSVGDKFIIEVEETYKTNLFADNIETCTPNNLYRIKGFNSLVFDKKGLDKLEKYDKNAGYDKGLSDAWKCLKKVRNKDADELKEIFDLPFTKNAIDILVCLTPQEAIDKLKTWKERQEIKVGDVIYSNLTKKTAVVQKINSYGRWECFSKRGQFKVNDEGKKFWTKTGKHIDLTEIFKELEDNE